MPGMDGTGPLGQGSQSGRRKGRCAGKQNESLQTENRQRRGFRFRFEETSEDDLQGNYGRRKGRGNRMGRHNKFDQ